MHRKLLLGLTGGVGSGKSTVAAMLARRGAAVIDADAISRSLTEAGGAAIAAIARAFGPQFIDADGALDRNRMREKVFADPTARKKLEIIIHPLVGSTSLQQVQARLDEGSRVVLLDIPLLVESGHWRPRLNRVIVVDCAEETQVTRTMARSGLTRETVEGIMRSQASRCQRRAAADTVIVNDGLTLDELQGEVDRLADLFAL
ncbi:MAG: dephospho-CoA kinase [Burkholderiaceae bacterium]|nr:dephospho-CoA kinase [Burkholderiaceae bacterium]